MTPTYIMPPKPTCKVVKREGQRGARIDPKGCKVRTTKDAQGNKRQYNKRGEEKITLKTTGNVNRSNVRTPPQIFILFVVTVDVNDAVILTTILQFPHVYVGIRCILCSSDARVTHNTTSYVVVTMPACTCHLRHDVQLHC